MQCLCLGCKILYVNPTDVLLFLSHFCLFVLGFHIYSYLYFIYLYLYFTYFYLCITYFCLYFTYFYLDFSFTYLCLTSTNRSSVQFPPAPSPPITSLCRTAQQDNGHWTRGEQSTKNMNSTSKGRLQNLKSRNPSA